ncbi:hypothetical protein GW915_14200 [bacterium]|nr:hypothetical protein [bacterium]
MILLNQEDVIARSNETHNNKYDYSKVVYTGCDRKVTIICPVPGHGSFEQTPYMHMKGQGCPLCGRQKTKGANNVNWKKRVEKEKLPEKVCSRCKVSKPIKDFHKEPRLTHGVRGVCKQCDLEAKRRKALLKKPLPIYQTHKLCLGCGECKPVEDFGNCKKLTRCNPCKRAYRLKILDKVRKASKDYTDRNKPAILAKAKKHRNSPVRNPVYLERLVPSDEPEYRNGVLFVKCKKCGKHFKPTNAQCKLRVEAINNTGLGEGNFYCSDNCKNTCDIFNRTTRRKSEAETSKMKRDRACQMGIRKALKQLQCDEVGYHYCEICGDIIPVDMHHTQPVAEGSSEVNNAAGMMLECPYCHVKVHASC